LEDLWYLGANSKIITTLSRMALNLAKTFCKPQNSAPIIISTMRCATPQDSNRQVNNGWNSSV